MPSVEKQNIDWKAYGQKRAQIAVRIDRSEKQALDVALRQRGESISDLLLAYLRPIITEGTPDGQRAHEIISTAVQESIAWNKIHANGGFGDTEAIRNDQGEPIVEEWHSPEIVVRPRLTKGGSRVLYHTITQRAGMTRQDAIRKHVAALLDVWADTPDSERESFLRELCNPEQHRFVIAYSGFQHWTRFTAAHEMMFHQLVHQTPNVQRAANSDEQAFVQWAVKYLNDGWNQQLRLMGKAMKGADSVVLHEGLRDDDTGTQYVQSFRHYAIDTDVDNVQAWAGVWLNDYRMMREGGLDHETTIGIMQQQRIIVRMLRISNE